MCPAKKKVWKRKKFSSINFQLLKVCKDQKIKWQIIL